MLAFFLNQQTDETMMTWEQAQLLGAQRIITNHMALGEIKHRVQTVDAQPTIHKNALLVLVRGTIAFDKRRTMVFQETLQLVKRNGKEGLEYVVHNSIVRLFDVNKGESEEMTQGH